MRRPQPTTAAAERAAWLEAFLSAVARRASQPGRFTVYDLAVQERLLDPPTPQLWGVGTGIAHADGLIVAVGATQSLRPKTAKSLVRVWVGTLYAPVDPADVLGSAR